MVFRATGNLPLTFIFSGTSQKRHDHGVSVTCQQTSNFDAGLKPGATNRRLLWSQMQCVRLMAVDSYRDLCGLDFLTSDFGLLTPDFYSRSLLLASRFFLIGKPICNQFPQRRSVLEAVPRTASEKNYIAGFRVRFEDEIAIG
jgi:hypothetical protein